MPNSLRRVLLSAVACSAASAPAIAHADVCPEHARYATNGAGQAFCLFEGVELPAAEDVAPYCHWLEYGYIGFSWTESAGNASYPCPAGSYRSDNGAGTAFCIYDDLDLPAADGLTPYCHWLEYGYLGYQWDICAAPAEYVDDGAGTASCVYDDLALPSAPDLAPYCHWVEEGYLGFSFTESAGTAGYECPDGARQTDNGAGVGFCLFEDLWFSPEMEVEPACDDLATGEVAYSWPL